MGSLVQNTNSIFIYSGNEHSDDQTNANPSGKREKFYSVVNGLRVIYYKKIKYFPSIFLKDFCFLIANNW